MAAPTTAKFQHMIVEIETTPGSGVYAKICGLTSRTVSRTSNMATSEVPGDCDDESVPSVIERNVQSQEQTVSGSGVWSAQSHGTMYYWWRNGVTKNIRIQHVNAAVGTPEYETGPAYLTSLNNAAEKGTSVTAEISIEFDGLPTVTDAS